MERETTDLPEGPEALDVPSAPSSTGSGVSGAAPAPPPALDILSRVDLLRVRLLLGSLEDKDVRRRTAGWIAQARRVSVETGAVVTLDAGEVRWQRLPTACSRPGRYRRPEEPRFGVELAGFHLHATAGDDRPEAGPGLMDALGAAFHGRPAVVVTDLEDGCFGVDYHRDAYVGRLVNDPAARLAALALDVGVFCAAEGLGLWSAGRGAPDEGRAAAREIHPRRPTPNSKTR